MAKSKLASFELISVRVLAEKAGIDYSKLYNNLKGTYASLTDQQKTMLFNIIQDEVTKAVSVLGFSYEGRRIRPKE